MLTVHHLNNSRSQRVLWLLEELGVAYQLAKYERDARGLAPPELAAVHPLGKSPVITDGGETVAESAVILEYIVEKYGGGRLVPARDSADYRRYRYFMHYAEGSLMPYLLLKVVFARVRKAPLLVRPIAKKIADAVDATFTGPNLDRHVAFLDAELAATGYFAGPELTVADIQMSYPLEAIAARVAAPPARITDFVARIHERPAYRRALERGGPYSIET